MPYEHPFLRRLRNLLPVPALISLGACAAANKETVTATALTQDVVADIVKQNLTQVTNEAWPIVWMFLGTMALLAALGGFWIWLHSYKVQKPQWEAKKNGYGSGQASH